MANYNVYQSPALPPGYQRPSYGQRMPTDATPTYGQYQPTQVPGPPRYTGGGPLGAGPPTNPGPPSFGGFSGVNDPTLAPGASYAGGGGSGSLPPGAIPWDPFNNGNANILYSKGYRKKLVNGQWVMLPPPAPGTQQPATYFPN